MVTLFSKPDCPQCDMSVKALDKAGVTYEKLDVTTDPVAHARVIALGYMAAPVIVAGEDHWTGFRPDRIKALAV
jgi:glutaredoxin-like protein NrdH